MASLKVIKARIKSVNNTKKITQTMKLVAASKYSRAEKELFQVRPFGNAATRFSEIIGQDQPEPPGLLVALSGDRGLCGAIHSGVSRTVGSNLEEIAKVNSAVKLACIGEKNRAILAPFYSERILWVASEIGKRPASFLDAGQLADRILLSLAEHQLSSVRIFFNKFVSAMAYRVDSLQIRNSENVSSAPKFLAYEMSDEDTLDSWVEFNAVTLIFWMLRESNTSEQAARMTAMQNATKSASEMAKNLDLQYNRSRQATITKELTEIVSGASAVENK